MEERLQKLLSAAGLCSRRQAEQYILEGRVTVNGLPAQLGAKADPSRDTVALDGVSVRSTAPPTCLMLHKPRGYVSTLSDERGRPTVAQLVADCGVRVWPVGRLDYLSEGLLLLTNDGSLTQRLTHPSHRVEKEYELTIAGDLAAALPLLSGPIPLEERTVRAKKVLPLSSHRLRITITQGLNRQVRRMCAYAGLSVERLVRIREGELLLGSLPAGSFRPLSQEELDSLRRL